MPLAEIGLIGGLVVFVLNIITLLVAIFKLGRAMSKFELIGEQQAREIGELKTAVAAVAEIITKISLQSQRQDTFEERLNRHAKLIDDLRRGEGLVIPLWRSAYEASQASSQSPATPASR